MVRRKPVYKKQGLAMILSRVQPMNGIPTIALHTSLLVTRIVLHISHYSLVIARIASTFAAISVLACRALAAPQSYAAPIYCQHPKDDYKIEDVSDPYFKDAETVGGASCPAGDTGGCEHVKAWQHAVGVTQSVGGGVGVGLDLGKIFSLQADANYEYA